MSDKRIPLAKRREDLVAQAAMQRHTLTRDLEPWRAPFELADQGLGALRYIKAHPQWLIAPILLVAVLRPRRVGRWLGSGWMSWRVMRRLSGG